jgi:hypothetical protein
VDAPSELRKVGTLLLTAAGAAKADFIYEGLSVNAKPSNSAANNPSQQLKKGKTGKPAKSS